MNGYVFFGIIPFLICFPGLMETVEGGICWAVINNQGRCRYMLSGKISKEECCKNFSGVSTAWSEEDYDSGRMFFQKVAGIAVICHSCRSSCEGVDCGTEKKCILRSGRPSCVCPPCEGRGKNSSGTVCGNDGNTYRSACQLKRRACQRGKPELSVAYDGYCQSSCEKIKCPPGEFCIQDQNLTPHCVQCNIRCANTPESMGPVCGANGITYPNICVLRQEACMGGKAIPVAYRGKCKAKPTCDSIQCKDNQKCLMDQRSGSPRCVTCSTTKCRGGKRRDPKNIICGTNNQTYISWCHMIKDSCAKGFVIETKFQGTCEEGEATSEMVPMTLTTE